MTWAFEQFHLIGLAENSKRQYTKVVSDRVGTNRQKNKRPWAVIVLLCSCRAKQLVLHIRKKVHCVIHWVIYVPLIRKSATYSSHDGPKKLSCVSFIASDRD